MIGPVLSEHCAIEEVLFLSFELSMKSRNSRIGLVLFLFYLLLYGDFVLRNAFAPETMEEASFAGMNVAIVYGFGLIIVAFVLALFYGLLCTPEGDEQ